MKKIFVNKIVAIILLASFLLQDVVWANPEIASGNQSAYNLQIPSLFQGLRNIRAEQPKDTLEASLAYLVECYPDIQNFTFPIDYTNLAGAEITMDFLNRRIKDDTITVRCAVTINSRHESYDAVINMKDKKIDLERAESPEQTLKQRFSNLVSEMKAGPYYDDLKKWFLKDNWANIKDIVLNGNLSAPAFIEIHPSSMCNLACRWCRGRHGTSSTITMMKENTILDLIDNIHALNPKTFVRFSGFIGEPLTNPATMKALEKLSGYKMKWGITTNGILLDNGRARKAALNAEYINISLDAPDEDLYAELKRSNPAIFRKVINNIEELVRLKKETGSNVKINVSALIQPETYKDLSDLSKKLKELGVDTLRLKVAHFDKKGNMGTEDVESAYRVIDELRARDEEKGVYSIAVMQDEKEAKHKFAGIYDRPQEDICYFAQIQAVISPSGRVNPCCHYGYGALGGGYGNVSAAPFDSIWTGNERKKALSKDPKQWCRYCAPTDAMLNRLISFLSEAQKIDPGFIKWVESDFVATATESAVPPNLGHPKTYDAKSHDEMRHYLDPENIIQTRISGKDIDSPELAKILQAAVDLPPDANVILIEHKPGTKGAKHPMLLWFDSGTGRWVFSHAGTRIGTGKFIYITKEAFLKLAQAGPKLLGEILNDEYAHANAKIKGLWTEDFHKKVDNPLRQRILPYIKDDLKDTGSSKAKKEPAKAKKDKLKIQDTEKATLSRISVKVFLSIIAVVGLGIFAWKFLYDKATDKTRSHAATAQETLKPRGSSHPLVLWYFAPHGQEEMDGLFAKIDSLVNEYGQVYHLAESAPVTLAWLTEYEEGCRTSFKQLRLIDDPRIPAFLKEDETLRSMLQSETDLDKPEVIKRIEDIYQFLSMVHEKTKKQANVQDHTDTNTSENETSKALTLQADIMGVKKRNSYFEKNRARVHVIDENPSLESIIASMRKDFASRKAIEILLRQGAFDENEYIRTLANLQRWKWRENSLRDKTISEQAAGIMEKLRQAPEYPKVAIIGYFGPNHRQVAGEGVNYAQHGYKLRVEEPYEKITGPLEIGFEQHRDDIENGKFSPEKLSDETRRTLLTFLPYQVLTSYFSIKRMANNAPAASQKANQVLNSLSLSEIRELLNEIRAKVPSDELTRQGILGNDAVKLIINWLKKNGKLSEQASSDEKITSAAGFFPALAAGSEGESTQPKKHIYASAGVFALGLLASPNVFASEGYPFYDLITAILAGLGFMSSVLILALAGENADTIIEYFLNKLCRWERLGLWLLNHSSGDTYFNIAAKALSKSQSLRAQDALIKILFKDSDYYNRFRAAKALGEMNEYLKALGKPPSLAARDALIKTISEDKDERVRTAAKLALEKIDEPLKLNQEQPTTASNDTDQEPLITALKNISADKDTNKSVAYLLNKLCRWERFSLWLLKRTNPAYRKIAAKALGKSRSLLGEYDLIKILPEDRDPSVRTATAWALGEINAPLKSAQEPLISALRDTDDDVCRAAFGALKNLEWNPVPNTQGEALFCIANRNRQRLLELKEIAIPELVHRLKHGSIQASEWSFSILNEMGWQPNTPSERIMYAIRSHDEKALIDMGERAIPLLIRELKGSGRDFSWSVLQKIEDPAVKKLTFHIRSAHGIGDEEALWFSYCINKGLNPAQFKDASFIENAVRQLSWDKFMDELDGATPSEAGQTRVPSQITEPTQIKEPIQAKEPINEIIAGKESSSEDAKPRTNNKRINEHGITLLWIPVALVGIAGCVIIGGTLPWLFMAGIGISAVLCATFSPLEEFHSPFGRADMDERGRPQSVAWVDKDGHLRFYFTETMSEEFRQWNINHEKWHQIINSGFVDMPSASKEIAAIALTFYGIKTIGDEHIKSILMALEQNPLKVPDVNDNRFLESIARLIAAYNPDFARQLEAERDEVLMHTSNIIEIKLEDLNLEQKRKASREKKNDARTKPFETSPDMAARSVLHMERNDALRREIRAGNVFRVNRSGVTPEVYKKEVTQATDERTSIFKSAIIKLNTFLAARNIRNTVYERLNRIRSPGGILWQVSQTHKIQPNLLKAAEMTSPNEFRGALYRKAQETDILIAKDRFILHENGPIAHTKRGVSANDKAIWLGEKLFTAEGVSDADIANLILEEAKHILIPDADHATIIHSQDLKNKLTKAAYNLGEKPAREFCEADMAPEQAGAGSMPHTNTLKVDLVSFTASRHPQTSITAALYTLSKNLKVALKANGVKYDVRIHDMYADHSLTEGKVFAKIKRHKPQILALSLALGTTDGAEKLVKKINTMPQTERPIVIIGGALVVHYSPQDLKEMFPGAFIVIGEGEKPLSEVAMLVAKNGKDLDDKLEKEINDKIYLSYLNRNDLDKLAPTDIGEIIKVVKKTGGMAKVYLEASRGCPYGKCTYCVKNADGKKTFRLRPVEHIRYEVEELIKAGIYSFDFADEEFLGIAGNNIKRAGEIGRMIQDLSSKYGVKMNFTISCRADSIYREEDSPEILKQKEDALIELKKAGLKKIFLGAESGSEKQLNERYDKGLTINEIEKAIKKVRELGFEIEVGFIMFDPEASLDDIEEDFRFLERNDLFKDVSWFLNELRLQAGCLLVKKYRDLEGVNMSEKPDPRSKAYEHTYVNSDVEHLVGAMKDAFDDMHTVFYHLKSIIRRGDAAVTDDEQRAYPIYRKYRDQLIEQFRDSFADMLKVARQGSTGTERDLAYHKVILKARLDLMKTLTGMLKELRKDRFEELPSFKEMEGHVDGFIGLACDRIASDVLGRKTTGVGKIPKVDVMVPPPAPASDYENSEELVCWIKPAKVFTEEILAQILKKMLETGYSIEGISIFSGQRVRAKNVFGMLHPLALRVAREGAKLFDYRDRDKLREIYREDLDTMPMISAYELRDNGLNGVRLKEEEIVGIWQATYDNETYFKNRPEGINRLGKGKYVARVRHPAINGNRPFLLINGVCFQLKAMEYTGNTIALFLRGPRGEVPSHKKIREEIIGDDIPSKCKDTSFRKRFITGEFAKKGKQADFYYKIIGMGYGPIETLLASKLWFDELSYSDTVFGKMLLAEGYTHAEISNILKEPIVAISGERKPISGWVEDMGPTEAREFLKKVLPPSGDNSPDMAARSILHMERNDALRREIRAGNVFRVNRSGVTPEVYKKEVTQATDERTSIFKSAVIKLNTFLAARNMKNTVYERLNRIRSPGGILWQVSQTHKIQADLLKAAGMTSPNELRGALYSIAQETDILIAKDRFTLHENGPIAHTKRGVSANDRAIWLGEKLFTAEGVSDTDIANLILEEAKHILIPEADHATIIHSQELKNKLTKAAYNLGEKPAREFCEADMATANSMLKKEIIAKIRAAYEAIDSGAAPEMLIGDVSRLVDMKHGDLREIFPTPDGKRMEKRKSLGTGYGLASINMKIKKDDSGKKVLRFDYTKSNGKEGTIDLVWDHNKFLTTEETVIAKIKAAYAAIDSGATEVEIGDISCLVNMQFGVFSSRFPLPDGTMAGNNKWIGVGKDLTLVNLKVGKNDDGKKTLILYYEHKNGGKGKLTSVWDNGKLTKEEREKITHDNICRSIRRPRERHYIPKAVREILNAPEDHTVMEAPLLRGHLRIPETKDSFGYAFMRLCLEDFMSKLSPKDRHIMSLVIMGFSHADIGREFDRTRAWASAKVNDIMTELKEMSEGKPSRAKRRKIEKDINKTIYQLLDSIRTELKATHLDGIIQTLRKIIRSAKEQGLSLKTINMAERAVRIASMRKTYLVNKEEREARALLRERLKALAEAQERKRAARTRAEEIKRTAEADRKALSVQKETKKTPKVPVPGPEDIKRYRSIHGLAGIIEDKDRHDFDLREAIKSIIKIENAIARKTIKTQGDEDALTKINSVLMQAHISYPKLRRFITGWLCILPREATINKFHTKMQKQLDETIAARKYTPIPMSTAVTLERAGKDDKVAPKTGSALKLGPAMYYWKKMWADYLTDIENGKLMPTHKDKYRSIIELAQAPAQWPGSCKESWEKEFIKEISALDTEALALKFIELLRDSIPEGADPGYKDLRNIESFYKGKATFNDIYINIKSNMEASETRILRIDEKLKGTSDQAERDRLEEDRSKTLDRLIKLKKQFWVIVEWIWRHWDETPRSGSYEIMARGTEDKNPGQPDKPTRLLSINPFILMALPPIVTQFFGTLEWQNVPILAGLATITLIFVYMIIKKIRHKTRVHSISQSVEGPEPVQPDRIHPARPRTVAVEVHNRNAYGDTLARLKASGVAFNKGVILAYPAAMHGNEVEYLPQGMIKIHSDSGNMDLRRNAGNKVERDIMNEVFSGGMPQDIILSGEFYNGCILEAFKDILEYLPKHDGDVNIHFIGDITHMAVNSGTEDATAKFSELKDGGKWGHQAYYMLAKNRYPTAVYIDGERVTPYFSDEKPRISLYYWTSLNGKGPADINDILVRRRIVDAIAGYYDSGQRRGNITYAADVPESDGIFLSSSTRIVLDVAKAFLTGKENVLDLGSGNGETVFKFSQFAKHVTGIELSPSLYEESKTCRLHLGKQIDLENTELMNKDFFDEDFSKYDVIYIFWPNYGNMKNFKVKARLEEKLLKEMKPGAVFVINEVGNIGKFKRLDEIDLPDSISDYLSAYRKPVDTHQSLGAAVINNKSAAYDPAQNKFIQTGESAVTAGTYITLEITKKQLVGKTQPASGGLSPFATHAGGARKPEEFVDNMIGAMISVQLSGKRLVLAFHKDVSGAGSKKLLPILKKLDMLKDKEGFDKLLKNMVIVPSYSSREDLAERLEKRGVDPNDKAHNAVFVFAPEAQKDMVEGQAVMAVLIADKEFDPTFYYYPLFEIITVSLAKYLKNYSTKDIKDALKAMQIDQAEINIKDISASDSAFLIISLAPSSERYDPRKMEESYRRISEYISTKA